MGKNKIGLTLVYLPKHEQIDVCKVWMYGLHEAKEHDLIRTIMDIVVRFASTKSKKKIEKRIDTREMEAWMVKRFEKDFTNTPVKVANEYKHFHKWPVKMMPLLVRTAQKVKLKVRTRNNRAALSEKFTD